MKSRICASLSSHLNCYRSARIAATDFCSKICVSNITADLSMKVSNGDSGRASCRCCSQPGYTARLQPCPLSPVTSCALLRAWIIRRGSNEIEHLRLVVISCALLRAWIIPVISFRKQATGVGQEATDTAMHPRSAGRTHSIGLTTYIKVVLTCPVPSPPQAIQHLPSRLLSKASHRSTAPPWETTKLYRTMTLGPAKTRRLNVTAGVMKRPVVVLHPYPN